MAIETVKLTDVELQGKGAEIAQALTELFQIKREKKDVLSEFKARIDGKETRITDLSIEIQTGEAVRSRTMFDDDQIFEDE